MHNIYVSASITILFLLFSPIARSQASKSSDPTLISKPKISEPIATDLGPSTPIPGWKKFEVERAELWLPKSYQGGNLKEDLEEIIATTKQFGPEFNQMVQMMERNKNLLLLLAFDSNIGTSGGVTNVSIASIPAPSSFSLDQFQNMLIENLPPQLQILDREIVSLDRYRAGKLIWKGSVRGFEGKVLQYILEKGNNIWFITYTTGLDEFDQRLPVFEKSINTFHAFP